MQNTLHPAGGEVRTGCISTQKRAVWVRRRLSYEITWPLRARICGKSRVQTRVDGKLRGLGANSEAQAEENGKGHHI